MTTALKLFNGRMIPGVDRYSMAALQAACTVLDPRMSELSFGETRAMATQPDIPGKTVWYRVRRPEREDTYINVNPGEYRTTMPDGENDLVLEMPEPPPGDTLVGRLSALLNFSRKYSFYTSHVQSLAATLDEFSSGYPSIERGAALFTTAGELLRDGKGDRQKLTHDLYRQGLLEHAMPLMQFSAAMALFQIQAMTGLWIEFGPETSAVQARANPYLQPSESLRGFVRTIAHSENHQNLVENLALTGNSCYRDAGASVKAALDADSMISLCDSLVLGAHQYFVALLVGRIAELEAISVPLHYRTVQADEGYACTQSGIMHPATFLFEEFESEPSRIATLAFDGAKKPDILFTLCSPFWPRFTRKFAKTLIATAKILRPNPQFDQALQELHELDLAYAHSPSLNTDFERGWIDTALLKAYHLKGDEERVKHYAVSIAGKLIVMQGLAKEANQSAAPVENLSSPAPKNQSNSAS